MSKLMCIASQNVEKMRRITKRIFLKTYTPLPAPGSFQNEEISSNSYSQPPIL